MRGDERDERHERLETFAALSGRFDPAQALRLALAEPGSGTSATPSAELVIALASSLASLCDTAGDRASPDWVLRGPERLRILDRLRRDGVLSREIARRRDQGLDEEARDITDALSGDGPFARDRLRATIDKARIADLPRVRAMYAALTRAGPAAPTADAADALQSAVVSLEDQARGAIILPPEGSEPSALLETLTAWIRKAADTASERLEALFISGLPGGGKSALLESVCRRLDAEGTPHVRVRFDFDRPSLDVLHPVTLLLEAARQLIAADRQAAGTIARARRDLAREGRRVDWEQSRAVHAFVEAVGRQVVRPGRPLVFILDTLETLAARGVTHTQQLYDVLEGLMSMGLRPMTVIGAGRGEPWASVMGRAIRQETMQPLGEKAIADLARSSGTDPVLMSRIRELTKGNPLKLRLYAEALARAPGRGLTKEIEHSVGKSLLVRIVTSRLVDLRLRKLAIPGLLMRRFNGEAVRSVWPAAVGLEAPDEPTAAANFEELAANSWLTIRDPAAPDWLVLRPTLRGDVTRTIEEQHQALAKRLHQQAAAWFDGLGPAFAADALYHRLQLTRHGGSIPTVDREVAGSLDRASLDLLPGDMADLVRNALGERSMSSRTASTSGDVPTSAIEDLRNMMARGDWVEAEDVHAKAFAATELPPATQGADVALTYLWRVGRWRDALRALARRDAAVPPERDDYFSSEPDDAAARLEMRAEFQAAQTLRLFRTTQWNFGNLVGRIEAGWAGQGMVSLLFRLALPQAPAPLDRPGDRIETALALAARRTPAERLIEVWLRNAASGASWEVAVLRAAMEEPSRGEGWAALGAAMAARSPYRTLAIRHPEARRHLVAGEVRPRASQPAAGEMLFWNIDIGGPNSGGDQQYHFSDPTNAEALFNERIGVIGYLSRHRDFTLIARRAEAWRRIMAGRLPAALKPRHWPTFGGAHGLDDVLRERIRELAAAPDPARAARTVLDAWTLFADPGAAAWSARGQNRLDSLLTATGIEWPRAMSWEAEELDRVAVEAARILRRRRVPSALVPPLAVRIACGAEAPPASTL